MIVGVIIDKEAKELNREFDYLVPERFQEIIKIGMRVKVSFRNQVLLAFVTSFKEESNYKLKNIIDVLDFTPIFNEEMLIMARNIAQSTASFLSSIINLMIPSALKAKYFKTIHVIRESTFKENELIDSNTDLKLLKKELSENKIEIIYDFEQKMKNKELTYIELIDYNFIPKKDKQKQIIDLLNVNNCIKKKELNLISQSAVNTLIKNNIIREIKKREYRNPLSKPIYKKVELNNEQQKATESINLNSNKTYLLHGVTGSGKTEIYLELIEKIIKEKKVIFLVPEISLTPMFSNRLKGRFENKVAVLHSKLSAGERFDEFDRIRNDEVRIVVGARSAIFAPIDNIGLIIVDEEHEESYIQDTYPRYNAIDVAKFRSKYHNCPLILGSATPNISDYKLAIEGKYEMIKLKNRAQGSFPKSYIVDMKKEISQNNNSSISRFLKDKLKERLNNKEQAILLINRRGHSSFVMCRSCSYVVKCPNCDVSLTYHKFNDSLRCHYCGYETININKCPECNSEKIRFVGTGTEKIVEEINDIFPNSRVLRMDLDTVSKKNSSEEILEKFANEEADILVGTQMIAKGLDFKKVTLVGILNADSILKLPDYKMSERTFDLIEQVSGRSGRHTKNGEVVIQSYDVEHYAIRCALNHDYDTFYKLETKIRKMAMYPPFSSMKKIIFMGSDLPSVQKEANKIAARFKELFNDIVVLGPIMCEIGKINNINRVQIVLKYNNKDLSDLLFKLVEFYQNRTISISIESM